MNFYLKLIIIKNIYFIIISRVQFQFYCLLMVILYLMQMTRSAEFNFCLSLYVQTHYDTIINAKDLSVHKEAKSYLCHILVQVPANACFPKTKDILVIKIRQKDRSDRFFPFFLGSEKTIFHMHKD